MICRLDDRAEPIVQIAPPLVADLALFEEITEILRDGLEHAAEQLRAGAPAGPRESSHRRRATASSGDAAGRSRDQRVELEQVEAVLEQHSPVRDAAGRDGRARSTGSRPRPPRQQRARRAGPRRRLDPLRAGAGSGTTATSSSASVQIPPSPIDQRRHDGVAAGGDDQLDAGSRPSARRAARRRRRPPPGAPAGAPRPRSPPRRTRAPSATAPSSDLCWTRRSASFRATG